MIRFPYSPKSALLILSFLFSWLGMFSALADSGYPARSDGSWLAEARNRSLELRRKRMKEDLDGDTLWPGGAMGGVMWSLSAMSLNEKVEEANQRLLRLAEEGAPFAYFGLPDYVRILVLFHRESVHFPGRLRPAVEDAVKAALWEWVAPNSRLNDARPDAVWHISGSENHDFVRKVSFYLTASVLKNCPSYRHREYHHGGVPADHYAAWNEYFAILLRERATRGLFVELGSDTYQKYTYPNLLNLRDLSPDPAVRKRATMFLDLAMIEEAQVAFRDGFRGGGKSRVSRPAHQRDRPRGAHGGLEFAAYLSLLYGDGGGSSHSRVFESTDYIPPESAFLIRLQVEHRRKPILIMNQVPGQNAVPRPPTDQTYALEPDSALIQYAFRTSRQILGGTLQDPSLSYAAISSQDRWSGLLFNDERRSRIVPHPEPARPDNTRTHDAYWNYQHRNVFVVQKLPKAAYMGRMMVFFSPWLEIEEKAGWVFAANGDAFAGIRVLDGGWHWDDSGRWPSKSMMVLEKDYSPVIIHAGDVESHDSLARFQELLASSPPRVEEDRFAYTTDDGKLMVFFTDYRMPLLDGEALDLRPPFTYRGPFLNSERGGSRVRVTWENLCWVYDFEANTVQRLEISSNGCLP